MSFFDKIKDKLIPESSNMPMSTSASGGIGNGRGSLGFEDDVSPLFYHYYIGCASRPRCPIFDRTGTSLRKHVCSLEHLSMISTSEISIVLLVFILILWILWLWVHTVAADFTACSLTILVI